MRRQASFVPLALVLFVATAENRSTPLPVSVNSCITDTSITSYPLQIAISNLVEGDSASQVSDGLPFPVDTVEVETAEQVCASVINAYNSLIPAADSVQRITRGIVMEAASVYVLMLPPEKQGHLSVLYFFSSSYQFITRHEYP